jgi:rhodanese-related sulfurtransferase
VGVGDGELITTGGLRVRAIHTPGHSVHHLSYVLEDATGRPHAVFTGGSLVYGATGRTDLVAPHRTAELAHAQVASVRRLAAQLPATTCVLPTHGFGSFCAAPPAAATESTIGHERAVNPALTMPEQAYVDTLLSSLGDYPAYYARAAATNRRGPGPVDLGLPEPVDPAVLRDRIDAGAWVVDLRARTAFAAGHLAGSLGFELAPLFTPYLGWLYPWGTPLTLVGRTEREIADARRELARLGIDVLAGMTVGDVVGRVPPREVRTYPVTDFAGLAAVTRRRRPLVLDVRRADERARGGVAGSRHVPLHELADRLDDVPTGEVWVYCGSGYRASIAASILDRAGRDVVLVDDSYASAQAAGLEVRTPEAGSFDPGCGGASGEP